MSDPKLISPLLDGFAMGSPISDHDGIRCCPAIRENSDRKYIVKIITIPPSQAQMDALLLAGAYRDAAGAMDYYRQLGDDVKQEAELLRSLSKLGGFYCYEDWQMEPITRGRLGYEIYLLGGYRRTLDKYVRRNPVTHLEAVNLGLDLCAALSACRQAGALYVDLKPTNIFLTEKKQYRIGDLGFVKLDALSYTALPTKYRSPYTPPELLDPMASLNLTTDTYALGTILYQIYNEGQLPPKELPEGEAMPAPANADYELAAILLRAIHPDPEQRWQDPKDMGKALVEYMQKNTVNDVPITPYVPLEPEEPLLQDPAEREAPPPEAAENPSPAGEEAPEAQDEPVDETLPSEADAELLMPHEMSDELTKILSKAEDLITHETPEGVVVPQIPEPPDPFAFAKDEIQELDDNVPRDPIMEESRVAVKAKRERDFVSRTRQKRLQKILGTVASLLALVCIGFAGLWYYQYQYIQVVDDFTVSGDRNQITVAVQTQADPSLLTVTCSDNLGGQTSQPLVDGQAVFTGLQSDTMYTLRLEVSGFHALKGKVSDIYTTDSTTKIPSFTAITGSEDGSAILNFTVDGEEPSEWVLTATAEGETTIENRFSGHSATLTGLTVGKLYTFTLTAGNDLVLSGNDSMQFMASRLILAQDLTITSTGEGDMTVHWSAPGGVVVESWDVLCYGDNGYEEKRAVTDTEVLFTGVDPSASYTVEVTAAGMTQPARTSITANPVNITAFHTDESDYNTLKLSWDFTGTAPNGGWLMMYTVDGSEGSSVVKCESPSVDITPRIPGAKYQFTIQSADTTSIFGNVFTHESDAGGAFSEGGLDAADITLSLLKTPEQANWTFDGIKKEALTNQFAVGDSISMVLHGEKNFHLPETAIEILYVISDTHGNALPAYVSQSKTTWKNLWFTGDYHYGELDLPKVPENPGDYVLTLYFNGSKVASAEFTIS